jgi:hypothetical protein
MKTLKEPSMSANTMAPPLADTAVENVIALMRTTRMPHARAVVAEVLATAKAPTLGPHRSRPRPARSRSHRPERLDAGDPAQTRRIPTGKTFDVWDEALSTLPAATTSFLRTLEWVRRRENLIACGPSGTGKTLLLEALGQLAIDQACPGRG